MKKIAVFAAAVVLTGCASENQSTQIVVSSVIEDTRYDLTAETQQTTPIRKEDLVVHRAVQLSKAAGVIEQAAEQERTSSTALSGYTIQILALRKDDGLPDYASKLPSGQPVWLNQKQLDGAPWFTLLYGRYASKEAAHKALSSLPDSLQTFGPFIRQLDSIEDSAASSTMTRLN
ncbi:SPOR domain-containing protein [Photobacterium ganghwense]|uniref:SPOR domain-containing protein n=1 Tax=Photobacterium ganghwense TaxID=320778 RepID=UPI00069D915B|nr:SPOR domain-containing protein [Photobacterium ganghwense]PSU06952.1 SPOR domain-containing protein [Photobacterium ganghwense]QSV15704.1 SPOR domain-containing protein [Photobacterium ganghwense]